MTSESAKQLNTFLKGVKMGEDAFKDFIAKCKNEELIVLCGKVKVNYERYADKITDILAAHHEKVEDTDTFGIGLAELMQKFRTVTKFTEESIKQTILETLEMAIDNSEKFLEKHEIKDGENYKLIRAIIDDSRAFYKQINLIDLENNTQS